MRTVRKNRRSLHYAPPDFLLRLVALISSMRLSLRRAAHAAVVAARSRKSGYAPVGMTILLCPQEFSLETLDPATELSSRPERSAVEGPAVPSDGSHTPYEARHILRCFTAQLKSCPDTKQSFPAPSKVVQTRPGAELTGCLMVSRCQRLARLARSGPGI